MESLDAGLVKYPAQDLHWQEPDSASLELTPEQAPSLNEVDPGLHLDLMSFQRIQSSSKKQAVCDIAAGPGISLPFTFTTPFPCPHWPGPGGLFYWSIP